MNQEPQVAQAVKPLIVPEIVSFPEEVDIGNAMRLAADLITAMRPGVAVVTGDLTRTLFCDSSGIRCLLIGRDYATSNGIQLRVVARSPAVRRSLHILGADTLLTLYGSRSDALTNIPPEST